MRIKSWYVHVKPQIIHDLKRKIPHICHTGLNMPEFSGSVALKLSRVICLLCLLTLPLYNWCINLRNVSKNVSLMPVYVLWALILDILPTEPASAMIVRSSWRVASLVRGDPIWTKRVMHSTISCMVSSFLFCPFVGVLLLLAEETLSPLPLLVPIESGVVQPPSTPLGDVGTVNSCSPFVEVSMPLTLQMWQSIFSSGPTWHANSLCIGLSPSRAATKGIIRTWSSWTESQAQTPVSHTALWDSQHVRT